MARKVLDNFFRLVSYNYVHARMSDEETKETGGTEVHRDNLRGGQGGGGIVEVRRHPRGNSRCV